MNLFFPHNKFLWKKWKTFGSTCLFSKALLPFCIPPAFQSENPIFFSVLPQGYRNLCKHFHSFVLWWPQGRQGTGFCIWLMKECNGSFMWEEGIAWATINTTASAFTSVAFHNIIFFWSYLLAYSGHDVPWLESEQNKTTGTSLIPYAQNALWFSKNSISCSFWASETVDNRQGKYLLFLFTSKQLRLREVKWLVQNS